MVEVSRSGHTDQFCVVMAQGTDTIKCMISVALANEQDNRTNAEKHKAALSKANALAKALGRRTGARLERFPPRM